MPRPFRTAPTRRRAVLGALATGLTSAGCLRRARTATGWGSEEPVSLTVKTLPADADPYALRVARALAAWYRAAGITVRLVPVAEDELLRQVLLNDEFDLFVGRLGAHLADPDHLYALFHSRFAENRGHQNPFGFADLTVDEALETQRRTDGKRRWEAAAELQRTIARAQPMTTVAFPDDIRAGREGGNWRRADLRSPAGYLETGVETGDLRLVVTDGRVTENLNPLSAEYRRDGAFTGLLYDPLGRATGSAAETDPDPWLASSWTFSEGETLRATVELRSDLQWHDGASLTASDVAFTYRLLANTALDDERNVPAPRFQGRTSIVSSVETAGPGTVVLDFGDRSRSVAARALTVPILPEHVWSERTGVAEIGGMEVGTATEALVTNNVPPVGSGPLQFVSNSPRQSLVLEPFEEHFLGRENEAGATPERFSLPTFERLVVRPVGASSTAVEVVRADEADLTATPVGADTVPRIARSDDLELLVDRSRRPYVVGYNTGRDPLSNPRFRNVLARLVDQEYLVSEVFQGYARPASGALDGTDWAPDGVRWDEGDPVAPFLGADGELDTEQARKAFRDAGFTYRDGKLVQNV